MGERHPEIDKTGQKRTYLQQICCKDNTAGNKQSRTFLECADDNFLAYVTEQLMRGRAFAGPNTDKEEVVGDGKVKGSLECSDYEMV